MAQIDGARQLMTSALAAARTSDRLTDPASESFPKSQPVASAASPPDRSVEILRIPHITVQVFCDTPSLIGAIEGAVADRRMARASAKLLRGGIAAAIDLYSKETPPNLIIIENHAPIAELYAQLDALAAALSSGV
jgi:hypothetical protein